MATYIIGDVQGCYLELQQLLELINFDPRNDRLGFAGDLVNRGPDSLETLRFVKGLADPLVVLGNHDLYLLAIGYGAVQYHGDHSLQAILSAPDKLELLDWLRQQPLVIYQPDFEALLVHAGIPPQWSLQEVLAHAENAAQALRGPDFLNCLQGLEFNRHPEQKWNDRLEGMERIRYIINAFTLMRFCKADGTLDLRTKTARSPDPEQFKPWYDWYPLPQRVFFGHWAALEGRELNPRCEALDTGCVWGGSLTAYCIEQNRRFSVPAHSSLRGA